MAYRFDFDSTHRVLRGQLEGRISDEELIGFYNEIERQCTRVLPEASVADCSAVTSFDGVAETIRTLAKSAPAIPDPEKPRFIVAPAPDIYGLARMFQFEGESMRPNLHVVRSLREVCAIMGVRTLRFGSAQAE